MLEYWEYRMSITNCNQDHSLLFLCLYCSSPDLLPISFLFGYEPGLSFFYQLLPSALVVELSAKGWFCSCRIILFWCIWKGLKAEICLMVP